VLFLYLIMNKMKIYVEDEGKVIFQTGDEKEITPKTSKEVDTLIRKLKHNITFLKGVKFGIENVEKKLLNIGFKTAEIKEKEKSVDVLSFVGGLSNQSFFIGDEFNISKTFSSGTIKFISKSDIYYGNPHEKRLLVKKGDCIPYYHTVQSWANDQIQGNKANVVLDLRCPGLNSKDFKPGSLNDGQGNYGDNFKLEVISSYSIQV